MIKIDTLDDLDVKEVFKTKTFNIEFDSKVLFFDVRRYELHKFLIVVNTIVSKYHSVIKTPSGEVLRNERKVLGIDIPIGLGNLLVEYDNEMFGIDEKFTIILKENLKKLFDLYNSISEDN